MPTLAFSTGSLYTYGLTRAFELAAMAGFDAVEVLLDDRWDTRQPSYLQQLSRETGLPVVAVHSPFVFHVSGWPQDPEGRLRKSVALARQVGAGVVVTHLPLRMRALRLIVLGSRSQPRLVPIFWPTQGDYRRFVLNGLSGLEAQEGVRIGVENMPAKRFLGRDLNFYAFNDLQGIARLPHLTLDTTHLGTWGLDPCVAYERLRSRVIHVHLSNFNGREHRLPDEGHLPLRQLLQRLVQDGYQGVVSVELDPEVLAPEDETQVLSHLRRAVRFCRESMGQ
jgi:sugar phosphate isomerase/epimerase